MKWGWLEALAYGVARGIFRAWFDSLDEREVFVREVPDAKARDAARRIRDAVGKLPELPPGASRPDGPPHAGGTGR